MNKSTPMGIGNITDPSITYRNRHRWMIKIDDIFEGNFCKIPIRPTLQIEEKVLEDGSFALGERNWLPLEVTFQDADLASEQWKIMGDWWKSKEPKNGSLELYDGCGNMLEVWSLNNMTLKDLEFQDLDCNSANVEIMVTLKLDEVKFNPNQTQD